MRDAREILAAQTGAGNSAAFFVTHDKPVTVIVSPDLAGAETADVQVSHDDGTTWVDYIDGIAVELTETKNTVRLYGPALFRVAKDATVSETGLYVQD